MIQEYVPIVWPDKKVSIFTWDSVGADAPGIFVCLNIAATRHDRRRAVRLPRKV